MATEDPYRGSRPRALIKIGAQFILAKSFDLTDNNKQEATVCNITIPLENVDSTIFDDDKNGGDYVPVQVWAGYVEDVKNPDEQLNEITARLNAEQPDKYLSKRFDGYVFQPEWKFGNENLLVLKCVDWTGILRAYKFTQRLEGGQTEASNVVGMVQNQVNGLTIKLQSYPGSQRLGTHDNTNNTQVFNSGNMTLFNVLEKVAEKLGYFITTDGKTIILKEQKPNPIVWHMYYGPRDYQKKAGVSIGQYFEDMEVRFGAKGRPDQRSQYNLALRGAKGSVVVRVLGVDHTKTGKSKNIDVTYPDGAVPTALNQHIIRIPYDLRMTEAKAIAQNEYNNLSKNLMTGSFSLPFANNFMNVQDVIRMETADTDMDFLHAKYFTINSITESYNESGYKQRIEFESDPSLNEITDIHTAKRPVPRKKLGVTKVAIVSPNGSNIVSPNGGKFE